MALAEREYAERHTEYATSPAPTESSPVDAELGMLEGAVEEMNDVVKLLQWRLEAVLVPDAPEEMKAMNHPDTPLHVMGSTVRARIGEARERLARLARQVNSLRERLDI